MSDRSAFSQITGTRSGYLARMRSASDFLFSVRKMNQNDVSVKLFRIMLITGIMMCLGGGVFGFFYVVVTRDDSPRCVMTGGAWFSKSEIRNQVAMPAQLMSRGTVGQERRQRPIMGERNATGITANAWASPNHENSPSGCSSLKGLLMLRRLFDWYRGASCLPASSVSWDWKERKERFYYGAIVRWKKSVELKKCTIDLLIVWHRNVPT